MQSGAKHNLRPVVGSGVFYNPQEAWSELMRIRQNIRKPVVDLGSVKIVVLG